jgi:hypothetical protein
MNTFMAIMSQLFWGVTVGALSSAFSFAAKAAVMIGGLGGAGWWSLRWHRTRKARRGPGKDN